MRNWEKSIYKSRIKEIEAEEKAEKEILHKYMTYFSKHIKPNWSFTLDYMHNGMQFNASHYINGILSVKNMVSIVIYDFESLGEKTAAFDAMKILYNKNLFTAGDYTCRDLIKLAEIEVR